MAVQNFDEETLNLCDLRGKVRSAMAIRDSCAAQLAELNTALSETEVDYESALAAWALPGTRYKAVTVTHTKD